MNPVLLCAASMLAGIFLGYLLPLYGVFLIMGLVLAVVGWKFLESYNTGKDGDLLGVSSKIAPMAVAIFYGAMVLTHVASNKILLNTLLKQSLGL